MQVAVNIRLIEYGHEQSKLRKNGWIFFFSIENKKYVSRMLKMGV